MKVIRADEMGFCLGVQRAIGKVLDTSLGKKNIFTFGPLIHNKQFVKKLKDMNIGVIESIDDIEEGTTIIIRSHGISPAVRKEIEGKGANIVDGTCPKVLMIHKLVERLEKEGNTVIVIGDKDHAEIKGVMGNLENGIVVNSLEEIEKLDKNLGNVAVVVQTTLEIKRFEELLKALQSRYKDVKIHKTICDATHKRQEGAKNTAKEADVMIVVGGKHSSNTTHLADVCEKITKTYHIETVDELEESWFEGAETVGVTAGASAPDDIINNIILKIEGI